MTSTCKRLEREHGIQHALALDARGELHLQVDHFGAESLGGELEGDACARGGFGEQVRHRDTGERGAHRRFRAEGADKLLGSLEQSLNIPARQAIRASVNAAGFRPTDVAVSRRPSY